jgi:hypothetical protein
MTYYTGDAYRGDYGRGSFYKGDPGLLSFVGKAARGLAGIVTHGMSEKLLSSIPTFRATRPPAPGPMRTAISAIGGGGPGTLTPYAVDGVGGPPMIGPGGPGRHRAVHWNKATYITRGGGTSRWPGQLLVHPKGTEAVPSRRMNVGNARALRHSLHRISGFAHLAKRVMRFVAPKKHAKGFKFPKKRTHA